MYDEDHALERRLAAGRRRRTTAAKVMVAALLIPLAVQTFVVGLGVAAQWGVIAVAVPAAVLWILLAGRR